MKQVWWLGLVGAALFLSTNLSFAITGNSQQASTPARLLVKLKAPAAATAAGGRDQAVSTALAAVRRFSASKGLTQVAYLDSSLIGSDATNPLSRVVTVDVPPGSDPIELTREFESLPEVEYAQPDWQMQLFEDPSDQYFDQQWALHNTGQPHYYVERYAGDHNDTLILHAGTPGSDIGWLDAVQQLPPDASEVIVAIIDTGVDIDNPDLIGHIWTNESEIPNNGIDDDHNRYVDDVHGWDFCSDSTALPPLQDNDPTDEFGHGTHCAGIVGAVANNDLGIAGICQNCKIMPLKFYPLLLVSGAAAAVVYAADNGADVISMSFGSPFSAPVLQDAINYAHSRGVVLCAATGNTYLHETLYPAGYTAVIAVGASDDQDHVPPFSTYGEQLDLVAPGLGVVSLQADDLDLYSQSGEPGVHLVGYDLVVASGTSMACPHVAAAAALLRSLSPGLSPDRVKEILIGTAVDLLDPYGQGNILVGWDLFSGNGRLDLNAALSIAPRTRAQLSSPLNNSLVSGEVEVYGSVSVAAGAEAVLEYGSGDRPDSWSPIATLTQSQNDQILGIWNTSSLNGIYSLRLRNTGGNSDIVALLVANSNRLQITQPLSGDTVSTWVPIVGSAICPDFAWYRMEYSADELPDSSVVFKTSSRLQGDGYLARWNVGALSTGWYTLRLSMAHTDGRVDTTTCRVYLDSPFAGTKGWRLQFDVDLTPVPNYGDFDGDGRNEIILGTSKGVEIINVDGTIRDSALADVPEGDCRVPIPVGNLDQDDIDDFVCVSGYQMSIHASSAATRNVNLLLRPDLFSQGLASDYPILSLEDVNGSAVDDIVYYPGSGGVQYLYTEGVGSTQMPNLQLRQYLAVDLNRDNIDEFYLCNGIRMREYSINGSLRRASVDLRHETIGLYIGTYKTRNIMAIDIDGDNYLELVVMGYSDVPDSITSNYSIYAFDENLKLKPGWPHDTGIDAYWSPYGPTFTDMDGDGNLEYAVSVWTTTEGQLYVWNLDGTPYLPSSPLFATCSDPAISQWPLSVDINGDHLPDILMRATHDLFYSNPVGRLEAWDQNAKLIPGWPIVTSSPVRFGVALYTPILGDINQNGTLDLLMTTPNRELIFTEFAGIPYDSLAAPMSMWRGNRKFNNIFNWPPLTPTATENSESETLPTTYALSQNYPNPFNAATRISYALPLSAEVQFEVFNILGQVVDREDLGLQTAGTHNIQWPGPGETKSDIASGVYFYRVKSGDWSATRKMLLLK